jgi:2-polyprenyl-3-methyl-5-hydroxy-6-metoxy-1,4-benzoquinol methylase
MMFGLREAFDYLECSNCKCVQIVDFPASMTRYYPADYHSFASIAPQNWLRKFFIRLRDEYAVSNRGLVGKLLSRFFPANIALTSLPPLRLDQTTRILDVGCGTGILLNALGELGFRNLVGVDPFLPADVEYPNGVRLFRKPLGEVRGEFDLIMFHHSFEHIADPDPTLKAVNELLSPGGHCVVRMPTVSSYAWQRYGINWVQLDAPRHFYVHSVKSLRILAGRAGLELSRVVYDSTGFQFWASEQYALDIPLNDARSYLVSPNKSIFTKRQIADFEKRAAELNDVGLGDQAVFYLRKCSVA